MITTGYKWELQRLLRVYHRFPGFLPYVWNPKTQSLSVSTSKFRHLTCKMCLVICTLLTSFMWMRLLTKSYADLFITILGLTVAAGNSAALLCRWNWTLSSKYVHGLNQMINFENTLERSEFFSSKTYSTEQSMEKYAIWVIKMFQMSFPLIPLFYFPVMIAYPCNPPFLASWLPICSIEDGHVAAPQFSLIFLVLGVFDIIFIANNLEDALFHGNFNVFASIICLLEYIDILKRKQTIRGWRGTCQKIKFYRTIVFLEKTMNDVSKYTAIPAVVFSSWILQILCLYGGFKTGHMLTQNPSIFLFFMTAYTNMAIGSIAVDTIASRVLTGSKTLLEDWKKTIPYWNKYALKQLNALVPARIRFGDNFIDQSTAIVVQDFVTTQTVSLIIIE